MLMLKDVRHVLELRKILEMFRIHKRYKTCFRFTHDNKTCFELRLNLRCQAWPQTNKVMRHILQKEKHVALCIRSTENL